MCNLLPLGIMLVLYSNWPSSREFALASLCEVLATDSSSLTLLVPLRYFTPVERLY